MADPVVINLPRAVGSTPVFTIGTVSTGPVASVTQTGTTLNPVLNFVFPTSGGIAPPFAISDTTGLQAALDGKQAASSELTALSGVTSTSYGRSLLTNASAASFKAGLGIAIADVINLQTALDGKQPLDAGLTALGNLTTPGLYYLSASDVWSPVAVGSGLSFAGGTLTATGGGGGSGDVVGPASATNNGVALFDGTTGKLLKVGSFPVSSVAGKTGAVTLVKGDVGLGSVDNTADTAKPVSTAQQTALNLKANIADTLNTQTGTTYTLQASDNGKVVELNSASAVTVTAPVLSVGFNCLIRQIGAGQVTVAVSSTTMRNRQSHTKLAGQWAEASIAYRATNEFVLSGDTAA